MTSRIEVDVEFLWEVQKLLKSIQKDDTGEMIGNIWMGGNGGLLSQDTLVTKDRVMRYLTHIDVPKPSKS